MDLLLEAVDNHYTRKQLKDDILEMIVIALSNTDDPIAIQDTID